MTARCVAARARYGWAQCPRLTAIPSRRHLPVPCVPSIVRLPTTSAAGTKRVWPGPIWPSQHGQRISSDVAYLRPVLHRANLTVHADCLATGLQVRQRQCTGVSVPAQWRTNHGAGGA